MKETEIIHEHARYRMALETLALLGLPSYQAQAIAKAALEGAAPKTKVDQPVPVPTSEPWV